MLKTQSLGDEIPQICSVQKEKIPSQTYHYIEVLFSQIPYVEIYTCSNWQLEQNPFLSLGTLLPAACST